MSDAAVKIKALVADRIRPLVADRGGDLDFHDFSDGVVTLTMTGSPGASIAVKDNIRNLLRHYLPEVVDLRIIATSAEADGAVEPERDGSLFAKIQRLLDDQVNPAVRGHGGFIRLLEVKDDAAHVRFEDGCQGCAMAHVTLRQGVEVIIKEQVPEIVAVVDVTDHASGTRPYFKTKKS